MAPELSKAALGVHPLIPFYNVDCDDQKNKKLCSDQGVQGFPTIKVSPAFRVLCRTTRLQSRQLFPRGASAKPILFEHNERTASAFYYWVIRQIPHGVTKIYNLEDLPAWVEKARATHRSYV